MTGLTAQIGLQLQHLSLFVAYTKLKINIIVWNYLYTVIYITIYHMGTHKNCNRGGRGRASPKKKTHGEKRPHNEKKTSTWRKRLSIGRIKGPQHAATLPPPMLALMICHGGYM